MTNLNDLYNTYSGFAFNDHIIDSYELVHSLITEFGGQASFNFLLDPTLPMIKGDPDFIGGLFKDFIFKALTEFKHSMGMVKIAHIQDSKSWIFSVSKEEKSAPPIKQQVSEYTGLKQEFNLSISKNLSEIPSVIAYL